MNRTITRYMLLGMAVAVLCAAPARADRWYEDYETAVAMIGEGTCSSEAIQRLGAALVDHPKAGRTVRTIAVRTLDYLPYLQLARAYLACGAGDLGRRYLELAQQQGAATAEELAALRASLPAQAEAPDAAAEQCRDELDRSKAAQQQLQQRLAELEAAQSAAQRARRAAVVALLESNGTMLFEPNQVTPARGTPAAGPQLVLARLAGLLWVAADIRLQLDGHTDATGDAETNQRISRQRAEAVRELLVSLGIDGARLQAVGHGSSRAAADNSSEQGRRRNRRVEISVIP